MRKSTIVMLSVSAAIALGCSSGGDDVAGPGAQAADKAAGDGEKTIVMEVTGAKKADISYGLGADQSQATGAKVPWSKTMKSSEAMLITTLMAQNKGSGTITCTIKVDGKVVKTNSSEGEYSVVSCSASDIG